MPKKKIFIAAVILFLICLWLFIFTYYDHLRLFLGFIPLIVVINISKNERLRNSSITLFVIFWILLFHYESIRYFYLEPLFGKPLPKVKFLFPPAGWIMFYNVDDSYSFVEVYGFRGEKLQLLDPHDIFRTRTIGFDNIHRNVLSSVGDRHLAKSFCRFLNYRFPVFDRFVITSVYYPSITKEPYKRLQEVLYQCSEKDENLESGH